MKNTFPILILLTVLIYACQPQQSSETTESTDTLTYDSLKAAEYGADDYGMKKYVMAFLYRGDNQSLSPDSANALQAAHMQNIMRMANEGTLVVAGPFYGKGELRGIYIFDVQSIEAAENLTNTDPAIQARSLRMELLEWYGPAGLMALQEIRKTLAKKSI